MENPSKESRIIRRTIRDLVALSALPALGADDHPVPFAGDLAELLIKTQHIDFVYLLVRDQPDGGAWEFARTLAERASADQARTLGRVLAPWLGSVHAGSAVPISNPVGSGISRIVVIPLGHDGEDGVMVAGSREAGFPNEALRVVLDVAANQATFMLHRRRAEHVQNRLRRERDALRERLKRDAQGRIEPRFPEGRDITEPGQTEQALRESEARFRDTIENAAVGIAQVNGEGRFIRVNETLCDLFGYSRAELLDTTFQKLTHPDDQSASVEHFVPLMRGESTSYSLENRFLRKDGSFIWIQVSVSAQRNAAGKPAYAIAVFLDVSDRKSLEGELRRAKETAESANRAKDEFLANLSHEIRTPLNAIFGMTEQTLETLLTDDQRNGLETVMSAAASLLSVINDLLDFSRIESGKLELTPVEFSLRTVIDDTLRLMAVRAQGKRMELICQVRPEVPDVLVGDAGRLRQVLLNLVGNAIKFTTEGEVIVEVNLADSVAARDEVWLQVTVRDTGIGISLEHQEKVFRAFEQEDTSTTRRYGGIGLGLTIAARLVKLMGGTICVESESGRGSLFAFSAQFRRSTGPAAPDDARSTSPGLLKNLPILIVDDSATDRLVLEEWLLRWQTIPRSVGGGLAALDALWQGAVSGRPYALVLLDAHLPDIGGLELAARVRRRAEFASTRIILMSSGEPRLDQPRLHELQVAAHLLKPISQVALAETIHQVIGQGDGSLGPASRSTKAPATGPASMHILLAEDNEFNTRHVKRLLTRRGHAVQIAEDGRKALALLGIEPWSPDAERDAEPSTATAASCPLTTRYHLLLLDLHMPELDGYEVVKAIREREAHVGGHLPVIALTARSQADDRERCLAAGMDDYLAKPILAAELLAAIEPFVPPCPERFSERVSRTTQPSSLLAPSTLLAACGGEATVLRNLCHDFQTYVPARLAALSDALCDRDPTRLREAAHKLAGLLSAFSTQAGDSALDLEECAARGELDDAEGLARRLETMARELMRQVADLTLKDLGCQPQ